MSRYYSCVISLVFLYISGCGTPNDPEAVGPGDGGYKIITRYTTPGYAQDVIVEDTIAYLAQGEGGLLILDISDPRHPEEIANLSENLKGYSYKVLKKDSAVYLAAGNFGVSVVNVANLDSPIVSLTNLAIKPSRDFIIHKNYLLTAISELGINISEISYATQPDIRGGMITPGYARALCATPDSNYLLVACGEMGMAMLDIKNMQNGFGYYPKVGWIDTEGYAIDITVHPQLPYAYLACGTEGLVIIDYSDTSNFRIVGKYNTGGYAKEIKYKDNKIFLTTETNGFEVFDVSNVAAPRKIAQIDTQYALGFTMDDNYIYIADEIEGFIVIDIP